MEHINDTADMVSNGDKMGGNAIVEYVARLAIIAARAIIEIREAGGRSDYLTAVYFDVVLVRF